MARTSSGAGAVTAPNSTFAGGPLSAGFCAAFFAASEGVAAGLVAPLTPGLIGSAETAPQTSNNARPNASLRMVCGPASLQTPRNLSQIGAAIVAPRLPAT